MSTSCLERARLRISVGYRLYCCTLSMHKAGGCSERQLQATFNRHGKVQTQFLKSTLVLDQRLEISVCFFVNSVRGVSGLEKKFPATYNCPII